MTLLNTMKPTNLYIAFILAFTLLSCDSNEVSQEVQGLSVDEALLKLIGSSNLNKNVLIISSIKNASDIDSKVEDGWEYGWKHPVAGQSPGDELCRGDGISFARCVKEKVDEGYCVTVYRDGDDYVGIAAAECDPNAGVDW